VASLASLSHPNLVRICGVVIDPPLVVTEFHKHSLDSILQQAREQWRGAAPAADEALNSIGRRQVGGAKDGYHNNPMLNRCVGDALCLQHMHCAGCRQL
jgi:hypothetical protein